MRTHARLYADMRDTCMRACVCNTRTHARTHTHTHGARSLEAFTEREEKKNQWRRTLDANKGRVLKNTCSLRPQPLAA